ncbi:MAG TPA: hypothetical protein VGV61_10040 [Thermoanaerobaculia bacterium]|jgi:hypothetical protein|nr:hypothetical protein [Thermoanaerobaculia bacterium]
MPIVTIVYGLLLIVLGVGFYAGTGEASVTALIPAFFGVPLVVCGVLARRERLLKHAMHAAAVLGLLAFLGSLPGLVRFFVFIHGGTVARPNAVLEQAFMAALSLVFVVLCVRSFIEARRARAASAVSSP